MITISPTVHGYLDYLIVLLFLAAPTFTGMTGLASIFAYLLAGIHFAMTLATDFPLGAFKLIPFGFHGWVERVMGSVLVLLPFAFSFAVPATFFFVAIGIMIIVVGLLTQYWQPQPLGNTVIE